MQRLPKILAGLLAVAGAAAVAGAWTVKRQGVSPQFWATFPDAKVQFDEMGIPTLEAPDWERLLTAEGYVVASERLWQMDVIRRKAGGRLAEWFGEPAFAHDVKAQTEDRLAVAQRAADLLPAASRKDCDAYAAGVNRFISEQKGRWGLEYTLLRAQPEPWACSDTMLVALEMSDVLTSSAALDAQQWTWRKRLSPAWRQFLFPEQHPWNEPLFGATDHKAPPLPPAADWVVKQPLGPDEGKRTGAIFAERPAVGSNNWAWRGPSGYFLANDPHLANGVPDIWFALRLKAAPDDWAVGVTIPGLPGIVLGMNPALAWAFTNTGEDVDDYLEERISGDGRQYERSPGVWEPILVKTFAIKVKGESKAREVTGQFTARGPLAKREYLGDKLYARLWLPLQPGALTMPSLDMMRARTLAEMDASIDGLRVPAQNVLTMDRAGTIRYRTSGSGPIRRQAGNVPLPAVEGAWLGIEPQTARKRLEIAASAGPTASLATANARIWTDGFGGHMWYADDRTDRIRTLLAGAATQADMERFHHDTTSRFRKELLAWAEAHGGGWEPWRKWDGDSRTDPVIFAESTLVEDELRTILLGRVHDAFLKDEATKYSSPMMRAWLLAVIEAPADAGFAPFGLTAGEVATHLVKLAAAQRPGLEPHHKGNAWNGQHPFVGRVPVVGGWFAVKSFDQYGAADAVAAERPTFGPSMRIVWNMADPAASSWVFPVGQSGHAFNRHYDDFQALWREQRVRPVFPGGTDGWEFHARTK